MKNLTLAKEQFFKDLKEDQDFIQFKKRCKQADGTTYGVVVTGVKAYTINLRELSSRALISRFKRYSFILLMVLMTNLSFCQTKIVKDSSGNYHAALKLEDKKTGHTYTDDKGVVYDIYVTSKGKYYINRKSKKTGKQYKSYLTI